MSEGKLPICVEACPLRALAFGLSDELRGLSEGASSDIMPLPDSSYTSPNFFVRLSPAAHEALEAKGFIANPSEIENNREV